MIALTGVWWGSRPSAVTYGRALAQCRAGENANTYAIGQVLRGEDTAEALLVINDEDTVSALRGAELAGLCNRNTFRDSEGWAGLQRRDSSLGRSSLASAVATGSWLGRGNGAFAGEFRLDLLPNGLYRSVAEEGRQRSCQ